MQKQLTVQLIDSFGRPYDLAVASARTCYSSKGIVLPEDVRGDEKQENLTHRIAQSTLAAGHLTTRQHATFVFSIQGISRHCVWSFLHSHPFYNSEQVSQRYVAVRPEFFHEPKMTEKGLTLYRSMIEEQMQTYQALREILEPVVARLFYERFPARKANPKRWKSLIQKRAMEVARYVLPVATHTYLYHSISALTLMRYHQMCCAFDVPDEQEELVRQMVDAVCGQDRDFMRELQDPVPLDQTDEYRIFLDFLESRNESSNGLFAKEFDANMEGRYATLIDYSKSAEATLAESVRATFGMERGALDDSEALQYLLDPKENKALSLPLNTTSMSKLSRSLAHAHYTFKKRISHTADSQDQRHRMVPGARPLVFAHYHGEPDYITPSLIEATPEAKERFDATMELTFAAINQLRELGETQEAAMYLLPNAWPIRFIESGDLLNLFHKWKLRTCFLSQEEIFHATVEEIEQVAKVHPKIAKHMKPPCYMRMRAGEKPFCPERDRYCGVPVWKKERSEYERVF